MKKRGQIFLVAAVILAFAIFSISLIFNDYEEKILLEDFPDLTKNYQIEAKKIVNEALLSDEPIEDKLDEFTLDYVNYARTIDPNIGFVYVYKKVDEAKIKNYGNAPVDVLGTGPTSQTISNDTVFNRGANALTDISLEVGNISFKKTIPVRLTNFGDYDSADIDAPGTGQLQLEIGGFFYPITLKDKGLSIIATSNVLESQRVNVN